MGRDQKTDKPRPSARAQASVKLSERAPGSRGTLRDPGLGPGTAARALHEARRQARRSHEACRIDSRRACRSDDCGGKHERPAMKVAVHEMHSPAELASKKK